MVTRIRTARSLGRRRYFNTSSFRREAEGDKESDADTQSSELSSVDLPPTRDLDQAFEEILRRHGRIQQNIPEELKRAPPFREMKIRRPKPGALNMGMKQTELPEDDPEFEEDDITSLAHGQLEQHREFRHYARLAAWEMPLLTSESPIPMSLTLLMGFPEMAKPFVPPTQKEVLRFRYTNYMGEHHPAEKKVVVQLCPADMLDLTDVQREKLKKLAGSRWNPETDIIKMSCEMFETQAQNKRYVGDLVETLLREARVGISQWKF